MGAVIRHARPPRPTARPLAARRSRPCKGLTPSVVGLFSPCYSHGCLGRATEDLFHNIIAFL